jgi:diguanylate cyclase (GGDEF)-like protein
MHWTIIAVGIGIFIGWLSQLRTIVELRKLATENPVTGLLNQRGLQMLGERMLAEWRREDILTILVVFIDMNGFKRVNDLYGHGIGNRVLQCFATHLTNGFRATDIVANPGGDEFVLLLPDCTVDQFKQRMQAVHDCACERIASIAGGCSVSFTSGFAQLGHTPNDVVRDEMSWQQFFAVYVDRADKNMQDNKPVSTR